MNLSLITVNIVIADRTYRVKVESTNEEYVRKTAKIINDKIIEFKTQFAGKDMQDYIAMVLIWYATQTSTGNNLIVSAETTTMLNKINNLLDKTIENNRSI